MIDLVYSTESAINIHYNKLPAAFNPDQMFKAKDVCASTQRAINLIKDMFTPPSKQGQATTAIDLTIIDDFQSIFSVSSSMPGQFYFGDITSDGFPDILFTVLLKSGKSKVVCLLSHECT
jgi:hypothetical protein